MTVDLRATDEQTALAATYALVDVLADERQALYTATIEPALTSLRERRDTIEASPVPGDDDAQAIADISAAVTNLETAIESAGESVRPVGEPTVASSAPAPIQGALLGLGAGTLGAFGLAVLSVDRQRERRRWNATTDIWPQGWLMGVVDEPTSPLLAHHSSGMERPNTGELAAYRWVLARVLRPAISIIGVAGTAEHDGSGLTAVALAQAHASTGRRVVLVSLDIPGTARSAEEETGGLRSILTQELSLNAATIPLKTSAGSVYYLPPGQDAPEWQGFHQAIGEVFRQLTESQIDLVIVELPPILRGAEVGGIVRLTDGVLLSSVDGATAAHDVNLSAEHVVRMGSSVLGEVRHTVSLPRPIYVVGDQASGGTVGADTATTAFVSQENGATAHSTAPDGTVLRRRSA